MKLDPMDAAPLTPLERRACSVVGISATLYRMGRAIQDRGPQNVRSAWEAGELATGEAYRLTLHHIHGEAGLFDVAPMTPPSLYTASAAGQEVKNEQP